MNKEAVQRLREPAGWVLLAAAGLQVLSGLVSLFSSGGFTVNALQETGSTGTFQSVTLAALLAGAAYLVTLGETPTPQARLIVTGALGVVGAALLFGVISLLAGMGAGGDTVTVGGREIETGVQFSGSIKAAAFLWGVGKLAVIGVTGWYLWTIFQGMQPAGGGRRGRSGGVSGPQGYPDYGYQQGQPGQPGQPGQQPYGYGQPEAAGQQHPQPYDQGQAQQPYGYQQGQQPQPGYGQQPYGQQQHQGYDYQQGQQGQQGQQPQPGQPALGSSGPQPQARPYDQQGGPAAALGQSGTDSSGWTHVYGEEAQQPQPQGYGQQYPQQETGQEGDRNWYRDDRGPQ